MMGSPESEKDRAVNECQHSVTVRSFSIGQYEVTQADWREVMVEDPPKLYFKGCDDCPVESVSWNDIQHFLNKLNAKYPGKNYRLPSEEEWEYAARGGNKSKGYLYSGSNDLKKVGWYDGNAGSKTHQVGDLTANELGIYDMSGNVHEWCQDRYGPYPGCSGSTGTNRVNRGGCWCFKTRLCLTASRGLDAPDNLGFYLGFRLASSPQ